MCARLVGAGDGRSITRSRLGLSTSEKWYDVPSRISGEGRIPMTVWPVRGMLMAQGGLPRGSEGRNEKMRRMSYDRLVYAVRLALTVAMAVLVVAAAVTANQS